LADYIGAIDQGTTSTRFIVFDRSGKIICAAQKEHKQMYPGPGWVEHEPGEIWRRTQEVIAGAMQQKGIRSKDLAAIGITNQRETTILWNRKTGEPAANALVWQDTRTDDFVEEFSRDGGQDRFRAKTGLPLATYFSGLKIRWLLSNIPGLREKAEAGEILFGNVDTFLVWKLTGGPDGGIHATDATNASRTQLMNLETLSWDAEILAAFGIPAQILPQSRSNTGEKPVRSDFGLLTTVAYKLGEAPATYALEGSVAITGALVQWMRDNLGLIEKSSDIEDLARRVNDNGGVYFVPAFSGLYAPYWKANARGVIAGLTRYANKGHLARAVLEAAALQVREVVEAMEKDSKIELDVLRVDGGMIMNELLMQFQSDILDRPVVRPAEKETTALGACYAAGLAVGYFKDIAELRANWAVDHTWNPRMDGATREKIYRFWKKAVARSFDWAE